MQPDSEFAEQLAIYIAGHFGEFIRSAEFRRHTGVARLSDKVRAHLRAAVETHPKISAESLAAADSAVNERIERDRAASLRYKQRRGSGKVTHIVIFMLIVPVVELFSVVVFSTTAGLRIFRLAVVNCAGEPASRLRMVWRTACVWAPGMLAAHACSELELAYRFARPVSPFWVAVTVMSAAVFVGGLIWSVMRPTRGLHDRLSGTHIVTR